MQVSDVKALIGLVFGVPMAISLLCLMFGDVLIAYIDRKDTHECK